MKLDEIIYDIDALAEKAGTAIMGIYNQDGDVEVTYKKDDSPLTRADTAANDVIVDGLKALAPEVPILSEESKSVSFDERSGWKEYWLVDPLDGTKEFIKRNGEFTVNIALVRDGKPVLGVVHAPVIDVTYIAAEGLGARMRNAGSQLVEIHAGNYQRDGLKVLVSRSHATGELAQFLEKLGEHEKVSIGSSLKLCKVAEGAANLYPRIGPTMEWDTAAAHCVVEQSGGNVTDLQGVSLRYNKENLLNPFFIVTGVPPYPWQELV